ncbi:hypothetical protein F511_25765 [Dorcoceras hygrometricum]|uniref:Splicing factor 3B subunit 1-like n=1 Tax=Dorcoceras hygrometricum TaxID=472368 RepID=A0A2Z7BXN6_9LAMI|nr:hypothetical protein F511_25765 [Dorcoceras hygrometricum]
MFLRQPALEGLTRSARMETPRNGDRNKSDQRAAAAGGGAWAAAGGVRLWRRGRDGGRVGLVTAKAGSFDAVTHERFLLMTAIRSKIKINWSHFLFDILKGMVTPSSKQARGFAVQLSILLKGVPSLTLGESKTLPPMKFMTVKSIGTYIAKNKYVSTAPERAGGASCGESGYEKNLALVPVVTEIESIFVIPTESPTIQRRQALKRKLILQESDDEQDEVEIVAEVTSVEETAAQQIVVVATVETDKEEPVVVETTKETVETEKHVEMETTQTTDDKERADDEMVDKEKEEEKKYEETEKEATAEKHVEMETTQTTDDKERADDEMVDKEKEEEKKYEETEKEATDKGKKVEMIIDSEDTEPLSKVLKLTETSTSDEASLTIDDLMQQIPEDMMLPSVMATTKIKFGSGIAFKEVNWYKASLPTIDPTDKGKEPLVEELKGNPAGEMFTLICADVDFLLQIREAVVEEIYSFFYSFSLLSLSTLTFVSDLSKKEEHVLKWAETDSLQTVVRRRLYIIAKYREMLLRKFLEARHNNFESGTPTSAIDLQVLDLLSEAHSISLINLLEQLKKHRLEWTRTCSSKLFGGADVYTRGIHSKFYPNVTSTSWDCTEALDEVCVDVVQFSLFGHLQPMDEIPQTSQIAMPTVVLPTDFIDSIAQLRASVDQIRLEQLSTYDSIDELKAALSGKITNLEMAFAQTNTRQDMIFRAEMHDICKEIRIYKAALTQEMTAF